MFKAIKNFQFFILKRDSFILKLVLKIYIDMIGKILWILLLPTLSIKSLWLFIPEVL